MDQEQPKLDRGRPPKGPQLADNVQASDQARLRLKVILQTISGELTIPEACAQLGIGEARFHELRTEWLQSAALSLEPKPLGRPPQTTPPDQAEMQRLRERAEVLEIHLQAARVREQIALTMPHLLAQQDHPEDNFELKTQKHRKLLFKKKERKPR
jgi:hypothetical protein